MSENTKKLIEELKEVMMDLHRSAGQLDEAIRSIETEIEEESDTERIRYFIAAQANFRDTFIHHYSYTNLDQREKDLWNKLLIDNYKEES